MRQRIKAAITLMLFVTSAALGDAVVFDGSTVRTLRQNINLNTIAKILTGTDNPSSVAKDGPQGSLYLRTGNSGGTLWAKQDNGTTTNWTQLAGAGGSENTSASNLGAGTGLFASEVGDDLRFKSLTSSDSSIVITSSGTEVNLAMGGSTFEEPAFGVVAVPTGTNPVAVSASDLLTLRSSDGTVTITGEAGKRINLQAAAGGASGSGTTNRITKWTSSSAIGDSAYEEASGKISRPSNTSFELGSDSNPLEQLWLGRGSSSATPNNVIVRATAASGTDTNGVGMTIVDGAGTGLGGGGGISLQTTPPGVATGSGVNTSLERLSLDENGNFTFMVTNDAAGSKFKVLGDGGKQSFVCKTDNGYCSSGIDNTAVAQLFVVGQSSVDDQVLVAQGSASGQTVNTFEVRRSDATPVFTVENGGSVFVKHQIELEETGSGTDQIILKAPTTLTGAGSNTYTLPADYPLVSGMVMSSTDAGVMSWILQGSGVSGSGTDNFVPRWNGTTALENSVIYTHSTDGLVSLNRTADANIQGVLDIAHPGGSYPHILVRQDFTNNLFEARTTTVPGGDVLFAIEGDGGIWGNQTNIGGADFRWDSDAVDNLLLLNTTTDSVQLALGSNTARTDSSVTAYGINSSDIPLTVQANTGVAGGTKIVNLIDRTGGNKGWANDAGVWHSEGGGASSVIFGNSTTATAARGIGFGNVTVAGVDSVLLGYTLSNGASASGTKNVMIGHYGSTGSTGFTDTLMIGGGTSGSNLTHTANNQGFIGGPGLDLRDIYFGTGAVSTSPQIVTLYPTGESGTNQNGVKFNISDSLGTGSGASGDLAFQIGASTTSGTALHVPRDVLVVKPSGGVVLKPTPLFDNNDGSISTDLTQKAIRTFQSKTPQMLLGVVGTKVDDSVAAVQAGTTSLKGTITGTDEIYFGAVGKQVRLKAKGYIITSAAENDTVTFSVSLDGSNVWVSELMAVGSVNPNGGTYSWDMECDMTARTLGSSGTVMTQCQVRTGGSDNDGRSQLISFTSNTTTATVNTNNLQTVDWFASMLDFIGVGDDSTVCTNASIEMLN